jgi:hypothetical protein
MEMLKILYASTLFFFLNNKENISRKKGNSISSGLKMKVKRKISSINPRLNDLFNGLSVVRKLYINNTNRPVRRSIITGV